MLNGYENLDHFKEVEEQDLDSLGIKDPDTRSRILTAAANILDYEHNSLSIVGQISEGSTTNNTSSSSRDSGCFTDPKATNLLTDVEENAPDFRQSSPSTDNSSGYQSRGNYSNMAVVSNTLQEVPDTAFDSSSSSTEDNSAPGDKSSLSSSVKTLLTLNGAKKDSTSEPDSYRATPVVVRPGTPELEDLGNPEMRRKRPGHLAPTPSSDSPRSSTDTGVSIKSHKDDPPADDQG